MQASQRERLLRAIIELVHRQGYDATTVPQVVAAARVSRRTFYELFTDKVDCFIVACDEAVEELLAEFTPLLAEPGSLPLLREGVKRYLRFFVERPALCRVYFIELPRAGERASAQRDQTLARFRALLMEIARRAREEYPSLPPLGELDISAAVYGTNEIVAEHIRKGRIDRLPDLEDDLFLLLTRLLLDDATAAAARERMG